jgi:hypothetical protein
MLRDNQGNAVPELFEFLLKQYQMRVLGPPGQPVKPSAWEELCDQLKDKPEAQAVAAQALNHFLLFSREFLLEHPPQVQLILSQGFGVQLAGGYNVSLVPPVYDDQTLEDGGVVAVSGLKQEQAADTTSHAVPL